MSLDFLDDSNMDHVATRAAVRDFFKKQYPRLKDLSSMDLQGVNYSSTKTQASRTNSVEDRTIRVIQAKKYLNLIDQCINSLDEINKKIFISLAIRHMSYFQVQELVGYGDTQICAKYGQACEQIAEMLALISDIDLRRYERN